jgi:hypothetical protein
MFFLLGISKHRRENKMKIIGEGNTLKIQTDVGANLLEINQDAMSFSGVFWENGQTVSANYTITTNRNAVSAGPITINNGVTVTIPDGSEWSIV